MKEITDINTDSLLVYDMDRLSFYKIVANVEIERGGTIIDCPVSSPVFVKFRQEIIKNLFFKRFLNA